MRRPLRRFGAASAILAGLVMSLGTAQAGVLVGDGNAIGGSYNGSVHIYQSMGGPFVVDADVDFAVYAPGDFDSSFPGEDPSGGSLYVYAYQVFNSDSNIKGVTVGLHSDAARTVGIDLAYLGPAPGSPAFVAGSGNEAPTSDYYVGSPAPTSVRWDFTGGTLGNGESSDILIFTSVWGPGMDSCTVMAGWTHTGEVVSPDPNSVYPPAPEPASLALLGLGAAVFLTARSRRADI